MKCAKCGHEAKESPAMERKEEGKTKRPFPLKKKGKK